MINLHIEGTTVAELHEKLKGILYGLAEAPAKAAQTPAPNLVEATRDLPKLTKKQREALEAAAKAESEKPTETVVEQKPEPAKAPDIEAVREKLKAMGAKLGTDAVFELLGKFAAKKASDVPDDKRAALIADIDAQLEG
jgi:hypothetical protein